MVSKVESDSTKEKQRASRDRLDSVIMEDWLATRSPIPPAQPGGEAVGAQPPRKPRQEPRKSVVTRVR